MVAILVSNAAGLQAALTSAKAGDTISLRGGDYGDFKIKGVNFASDVRIVAADATKPPVFNTIDVIQSSHIKFENIVVDMHPTETTVTSTPALEIRGSSFITFSGGRIEGGDAISGVSQDALALEKGGNVIGMPTGEAALVFESKNVVIDKVQITDLAQGIVLSKSSGVTVSNNNIHDIRTSHIISGGTSNLTITGNHLSDSNPWNWGAGDHGDFIHLFTIQGDKTTENVIIKNNVLDQGQGTAILGIYLDDNKYGVGYTKVDISNNLIVNGNSQGVRLENVTQSTVANNVMVQSDATQTKAPGILVKDGSTDVVLKGNYTNFVDVDTTSLRISTGDNFYVQANDSHKAGFYQETDMQAVDDLTPQAALDYISTVYKSWTDTDYSAVKIQSTPTFDFAATSVGMKLTAKTNDSSLVVGGGGDDLLTGRSGNDTIAGGAGGDTLNGAGGDDLLYGGQGADTFNFDASYPTTGGTDVVVDFSRLEGDVIRLHSIDADITNAAGTNDKFRLIGEAAFSKSAGELRVDYQAGDAIISGDVNGDGVADFAIRVVGGNSIVSSDFIF